MSIRVAINHSTTYHFDKYVSLSPHTFRLRPAVHSRTKIESYSFKVLPKNHFINWQQDPFGNFQARVVFPEKTEELRIDVEVVADMVVINPFDFFVEDYAENFPFEYTHQLKSELFPYLHISDNSPLLLRWVESLDKSKKNINDFLVYVNQKLNREIQYTVRMEPGVQTCEETLGLALGSCRDTAWLQVQIFRRLGIASRFVSGYLVQLTADIKSLDGPSGPENDFTDLHAWTEVYIPGAGWIGLDPTSGLFAGEGHIPLACTPHFASAAPVVGASDPCKTEFSFSNIVTRIYEDPRVTKPYSDTQWAEIFATGLKIDEDIDNGDLRMTMGGEPTFVSIDDMESDQWNTMADGKEKRKLSHDLIFRLREKFGPQGMIHYGMGKWYPGEPLPRWQYGLYWRKDQHSIWKNEALIAKENERKFGLKDAEMFVKELTKHLAINEANITEAFEDSFYYLWKEGKLPANIDPLQLNLKDSNERQTLTQLLQNGLGNPVGYTLPIEWNYSQNCWRSIKWILKRQHLFLIPGSSPIGLRLPLDSLPVLAKEYEPQKVERSLFEDLPALHRFEKIVESRYGTVQNNPEPCGNLKVSQSKAGHSEKKDNKIIFDVPVIKTTLCVECRDGIIYVFLPPVDFLEHYLDLVASVEATSEKLQIPVRIEGYEPPRDYRIQRLVVSPDPGVIEVNIQPTKKWTELVDLIDTLYDEAYKSRLATEKFMIDGRHMGTGGGNHITIGGETPADSPLLRRPDLLRSLVGYWQHHPGLSYLFSSAFIGPTSQAPRIDEGRDEKLYEMEIAFNQVPDRGFIPFYLVDRIFRHLLTDITGNTHRAEFCIDKLYSPDSSSGRLGILEFRAFDMPPHKRMSLVQMLLIRGLIARFWNKPYNHSLVRWGTTLHDKFMLPHFVREDMKDVVNDLNESGYPFDISWLDPFFESRFPHYGTVRIQGIEMEIRMAIEPWHVLGEEINSGGTARYVDSSLERVQIKLKGLNGARYILLCNGIRVPLRQTAVKEEWVCGIRYRAWQPFSALHPTIGVDAPITFDIVDIWNSRSIGGCTYYVSHPGGRNYERFPINAQEAEARRVNRFGETAFTQQVLRPNPKFSDISRFIEPNRQPFQYDAPEEDINNEYPLTLDLRKFRKT